MTVIGRKIENDFQYDSTGEIKKEENFTWDLNRRFEFNRSIDFSRNFRTYFKLLLQE